MKKIALASDHAGFALKEILKDFLKNKGFEAFDCGAYDETPADYPDYAAKAARAVASGEADGAVLVCGTGIGISIAANRFDGVRAALCHDAFTARMSRRHNDSNAIAMGAGVVGTAVAKDMLEVWLGESFEGGRHERRIKKIETLKNTSKDGE